MHTKAVELCGTSVPLPTWNKLNKIEQSVKYKLFFIILYSDLQIWSGWLSDYKDIFCITISFGSFYSAFQPKGDFLHVKREAEFDAHLITLKREFLREDQQTKYHKSYPVCLLSFSWTYSH